MSRQNPSLDFWVQKMSLYELGKRHAGQRLAESNDDALTRKFVRNLVKLTMDPQKKLPPWELYSWLLAVIAGGDGFDEIYEEIKNLPGSSSRCTHSWSSLHTAYVSLCQTLIQCVCVLNVKMCLCCSSRGVMIAVPAQRGLYNTINMPTHPRWPTPPSITP